MRAKRFARGADCPTCGATPCHQKWKPRKTVNLDDFAPISDCNPVDAVYCRRCGLVFCVSHFEHDDVYITNWDEIETREQGGRRFRIDYENCNVYELVDE